MADRQAIPPSDGDLDEPPGGGSPAAGSTGAQGAQDVLGSDREAFARFQRFLQMEREEGRGPTRHRRRREREEEEGDDSGEGRGASGPPPSWDGQTPFEDYHIKAQLWIATTKDKAKSRGPLLLKMLTGAPFELYKHWAKDPVWLGDPRGAERLLEDMDKPERFGDDQQEHMLTAMSRITYHLRRQKTESWREYFAKWDNAIRKVQQHKIVLPPEYEGFLMINGLQLTESDTKALLNYTHGCIKPSSIKSWLRKNETKLSASELGADRKKAAGAFHTEYDRVYATEEVIEGNGTDQEEIDNIEHYIVELQDEGPSEDTALSESEAAEILSTYLQQKKTYTQSIKDKKTKELARGYGAGRRPNFSLNRGDRDRPLRPGSYSVTIAELQKRTRCRQCGQIGHWKRDCKNPPMKPGSSSSMSASRTNETHLLESTPEVHFVGSLEKEEFIDKNLSSHGPTSSSPSEMTGTRTPEPLILRTSIEGQPDCTDVVPASNHGLTARSYTESDTVLGLGMGEIGHVGVDSLFFYENMFCDLVSQYSQSTPDDATCATVDTGCQRLAIGATTLRKFSDHLPQGLKITIHPETNKFRSVHKTSITTRVANVPSSLGAKGSLLKPAVFDSDESTHAPSLLSLSFLLHCHGDIGLCLEKGLQLRLRGNHEPVPLHLGPTGALRIPLQQFTELQLTALQRAQSEDLGTSLPEFEVLKLNKQCMKPPEPDRTQDVSASTSPVSSACHAERRPEAQPTCSTGDFEPGGQGRESLDSIDPSATGRAYAPSVPVRTPLGDHHGSTIPTPGSGASDREHVRRGAPPRDQDGQGRDESSRRTIGHLHCDQRPGTTLGRIPEEGSEGDFGENSALRPDRQPAGDRDADWTPTSLPMRPTGEDSSEHRGQPRGGDLLPMPEVPRTTVRIQTMDPLPAIERCDQLEVPPAARRKAQVLCRGAGGDGSGNLPALSHASKGIQCLPDQGDLPLLQQGDQTGKESGCHGDGVSQQPIRDTSSSFNSDANITSGRDDRTRGLPGLHGLPALAPNEGPFKPVTPKLERKLRAALKKAVAFWKQIQYILAETHDGDATLRDWIRSFNHDLCKEFTLHPNGSKRTHQIAEIMGLSHKQLRTVAEIYNPGCFGEIAHRFNLNPGRAFDLKLDCDLLKANKRNEVLQYVKDVRPGLVCIAPPCEMYSQLQNLSKNKRERVPALLQKYLKRKSEGEQLLLFALQLCELCDNLGIKFLLEHPHAASSWKHRAMEQLLSKPNVVYTKADQCQYGLRGESGQPQRKRTGFATNSPEIAKALDALCPGDHQHEVIIGGTKSKKAQIYPEGLREAILAAYARSIGAEVYTITSEQMFLENDRLNSLLAVELMVDSELHPGHSPDKDQETTLQAEQVPGHELHLSEVDPERSDQVESVLPGPTWELHAEELQGDGDQGELEPESDERTNAPLPLERRFTMDRLLHRAHVGMGHPSPDRFVRILRYAKAKPEVIEAAKRLKCSVCQRHAQVRPARRSAPPKELSFNECVGVDVVFLPTLGNRSRPALNVIDWSSKFQLMIPLPNKKPGQVREAYRHWLRLFGPPKRMALDLGREFRGTFAEQVEQDGTYIDPAAVEAPHQRGITERHGKTFKYILQKTMDTYSCSNMQEWEEMVDLTTMTKNRMMNVGGYSPCQRVLGFNPFLPGGLLNGDDGHRHREDAPVPKIGDLSIERSMKLRKAAAQAFIEADADNALRRAISSGPRPILDYDIGEIVYFYRMGADKKLKFKPGYWQGPARIIMIDQPSTIWLAYQSNLVKASPERLRSASSEENMALSGWLDDIVNVKKDLNTEPVRGFLDLSDQPLPPDLADGDLDDMDYEPSEPPEDEPSAPPIAPILDGLQEPLGYPPPAKRYRTKAPQENLHQPPEAEDLQEPDHDERPAEEVPEERPEEHPDVDENNKREYDEGEAQEQPPLKRLRHEYLEIYLNKVDNLMKTRQRKEVRFQELSFKNQKCFKAAIGKEFNNNINIGAYSIVSPEESAKVRQTMPHRIMESRLVLTPKPLEPHEVEPAKQEGILLDWDSEEPCKAKARRVMKGFSEEGSEDIEATTPQVTREGTLMVAQLVASHRWKLGFLDFTQAFHSGDAIERLLYATPPREGIPGVAPCQLLKLEKVCYGLTDGPLAWYNHLKKFLTSQLQYQQSLADPCIYYKHRASPLTGKPVLSGIIAVATDDLLHGGDEEHQKAMDQIKAKYKLGKFQYGSGKFTGKMFVQQEDSSITVNQENYIQEKLFEINLEKQRKKKRYTFCDDKEITQLRASVGALAWLAKESRPDLAGRVALLQQVFPNPRIKDIIEANSITQEARKHPSGGIKIMPIPPENLRIGVATDASWSNARSQDQLEASSQDYWEEKPSHWIRHHVTPRRVLFHPGADPGPDLHDLQPGRRTMTANEEVLEDEWTKGNSVRTWSDSPWTGKTIFTKQLPGHELEHGKINDTFLKLLNCSSQGGYVMIFYDKRMETEDRPHMVSVTSWKSTKLKRKTVNTLSAECQSLVHGIGHIHWHRYLLLELMGTTMESKDWERHLAAIPYVSVVDSRSLYDCINKLVCTYSQVEDKRTAIDIAILKDDLYRSGGSLRWVAGDNMIADPLTKKMNSDFLRCVCNTGYWSLSETGHRTQCTTRDVLLVSLGR